MLSFEIVIKYRNYSQEWGLKPKSCNMRRMWGQLSWPLCKANRLQGPRGLVSMTFQL